ncbi:MAG: lanthionine synthetase LanC family protein [Gemmatimonadota bacterium]
MSRDAALRIASSIGEYLVRASFSHDGQVTWMGSRRSSDPESSRTRTGFASVGPTLYSGSSGIGLFLAELSARTGDPKTAAAATGALRHGLALEHEVGRSARFGFYGGRIGIAWALARGGELLRQPELVEQSEKLLLLEIRDRADDCVLDVILGAAGGAVALLNLGHLLSRPELLECARSLGSMMIQGASRTADGLSWGERATGEEFPRDLTGFAHGASGIGFSLLELGIALHEARFIEAANSAFAWESRWFSPERDNWPDFREEDGEDGPVPCAVAWCHGAPGIGLARLRALARTGSEMYRPDLEAAMRTTRRTLEDRDLQTEMSYVLCHGQLSLFEFLRDSAEILGDRAALEVADQVPARGAERHGEDASGWASGVGRGSHPSLMIGLAGIGYTYLRIAYPDVPSVLMCGVEPLGSAVTGRQAAKVPTAPPE